MVVRPATPEDSRAIATIHVLSWQAAYREGGWSGRNWTGWNPAPQSARRL